MVAFKSNIVERNFCSNSASVVSGKSIKSYTYYTIKELKSDISKLNRVDRITSVAMEKLGMIVAEPESTMVHVDPSLLDNNYD